MEWAIVNLDGRCWACSRLHPPVECFALVFGL